MSELSASRMQHVAASSVVTAVGLWVAYVSYTQKPAAAFLFPRLISTAFVAFALWDFAQACIGRMKGGDGFSARSFSRLVPGMVIALIYIFWGANFLGFYAATAIAFYILLSLYDSSPHGEVKTWFRRLFITVCFVAVMYAVFDLLLKVYTPHGILF